MEEGVKYINYDKNEINDEGKESECLYKTSPDYMEVGVNDRYDNKNEKYDEEKSQMKQQILISPQLVKVKE